MAVNAGMGFLELFYTAVSAAPIVELKVDRLFSSEELGKMWKKSDVV
jgi:hypothetical protein